MNLAPPETGITPARADSGSEAMPYSATSLLTRRDLLILTASALGCPAASARPGRRFVTRGVVVYPWDLSLDDWPKRASQAGITTIALHAARRLDVLIAFLRSDAGRAFLAKCRKLSLQVEFELHAMGELLSRELFYKDTELFRVDKDGWRNPDFNCCPSSPQAVHIIAEKSVELAKALRPTTERYFYWPDDGREWCHCPKCKGLTASDQATLVENSIVVALRKHISPSATLSHLSYRYTLDPPKTVRPHTGLFLEFAPINRSYLRTIADREVRLAHTGPDPLTHGGYLDILDANLELFGKDSAQVLEYWLDVSRFSGWRRPASKLPWNSKVVRADAEVYARHGVKHVSTFATWIDADYVKRFGDPPLIEYGQCLSNGPIKERS
jgi:hypothetical protein